jgi:N-methylhydantoinase B/oxoprolinase/acetone carboxylase alpha subunit
LALDNVTLGVMASRLDSVTREMTNTMVRTARSTTMASKDFSCSIAGPHHDMVSCPQRNPATTWRPSERVAWPSADSSRCARFGPTAVRTFVSAWLDYCERMTADAIAQPPAGKVVSKTRLDPFPRLPDGQALKATIEVDPAAGKIVVDLRDNPDCVPTGLNRVVSGRDARRGGVPYIFQIFSGTAEGPATYENDSWLTDLISGSSGVGYVDSTEIYGSLLERDPASVLLHVIDDYISVRRAADVYGVVLSGDPERWETLTVDDVATARRRAELAARRPLSLEADDAARVPGDQPNWWVSAITGKDGQ